MSWCPGVRSDNEGENRTSADDGALGILEFETRFSLESRRKMQRSPAALIASGNIINK